jgi:hypothetical protein
MQIISIPGVKTVNDICCLLPDDHRACHIRVNSAVVGECSRLVKSIAERFSGRKIAVKHVIVAGNRMSHRILIRPGYGAPGFDIEGGRQVTEIRYCYGIGCCLSGCRPGGR